MKAFLKSIITTCMKLIFFKEIYPVRVSVVDFDNRKCVVICTIPISSPIPATSPSCLLSSGAKYRYLCEWHGSLFAIRNSADALSQSSAVASVSPLFFFAHLL